MKYLISGKEMKNWEKQAMEKYKIPSLLLMERAAESVVKEILSGSYDLKKILIACGTGNNGGDGLAIARMLKLKGCQVDVCVVGALDKMSQEAKQQLGMYQAILPTVSELWEALLIFNVPFTFLKGALVTLITFLIYKYISPIIKGKK